MYEQIVRSYDIVWEHARPASADDLRVGVGRGLRESRLTDVFRQGDRTELGLHERLALHSAQAGEVIAIQALSARFYIQQAQNDLFRAGKPSGRRAKIRLLVINPISRGAILRAVADSNEIEDIGSVLRELSWEKHKSSKLYRDVHAAIQEVSLARRGGCDIELRLSAADLSCAVLLARDAMFIEQYSYGRSRSFSEDLTLGGEYTVFGYQRRRDGGVTSEERILQSAFDVLWDSYSISAEEFLGRVCNDTSYEEKAFANELSALSAQLGADPPADRISMVILAAGYGTRIAAELNRIPELRGKPKALLPVAGKPMLEWLLESASNIK